MNIYLSQPHITCIINLAQEDLETKLDYTFDTEKTKTLLNEKKVFLIDTFSTFVKPANYFESIIVEQEGFVAYLKTKELRIGFRALLKHYNYKEVGIHSDSLSTREFHEINNTYWQLDDVNFFGDEYSKFEEKQKSSFSLCVQKDFERMIAKLNATKNETLIIGDGLNDIKPAYQQNIDLLLVPTFDQDNFFDFRSLY